jgi:hypothetical protein
MWGGSGLLGVSIRFSNFENAAENVWHVLVSAAGGQSQWIVLPSHALEKGEWQTPQTGHIEWPDDY